MYCLEYDINGGVWRCRHTVPQKCSIPSLEEYTKSSPEVSSSLSFLLPGVSGQSSSKLLHLSFRRWMPTPQGRKAISCC